MKFDVPIIGFIIGLLLPVAGLLGVYMFWGAHQGFYSFLYSLTGQKGMAAKVLLLSVLPNLIPFAYCNVKRLDYALRGIFIATMLYALFVILIMFVW